MLVSDDEAMRRCALGAVLRHWRASKGLSVEAMAEHAGLSHMTWRRLEDGHAVRPLTYRTVEQAADVPAGLVVRALKDDEALIELAEKLGIEVPQDQQEWPSFLRSFAWPTAWAQQLTVAPDDDLPAVGALVAKLSARSDRSPTEDTALQALIAWMGELAGGRDH